MIIANRRTVVQAAEWIINTMVTLLTIDHLYQQKMKKNFIRWVLILNKWRIMMTSGINSQSKKCISVIKIDQPIIASQDLTNNHLLHPLFPRLLRLLQHLHLLLQVVVLAFRAVQCLLHLLQAALALQAHLPHLVVQRQPKIAVMVSMNTEILFNLSCPRLPYSQLMSGTRQIL